MKPKLTKVPVLLILVTLCSFFNQKLEAQTIVEVMVDQPEVLEINYSGEIYTLTDEGIVFGENITVSGGQEPYNYSWLKDLSPQSSNQTFFIPYPIGPETYSLNVIDSNNCLATLTIVHDLPVSAENPIGLTELISVYPNPASNFLVIDPHDINETLTLFLYNNNGNLLLTREISGLTIINFTLPRGTYLLRIENSVNEILSNKKIMAL